MLILRESRQIEADDIPGIGAEIYDTSTGYTAIADGSKPVGDLSFSAPAAGGGIPQAGPGTFVDSYDSSFVGGYAGTGALIRSTNYGTVAFGVSIGATSSIRANGFGSRAEGYASNQGYIFASAIGSVAGGYCYGPSTSIRASGQGSFSRGFSNFGGRLEASAKGALVFGAAYGTGSGIYANQQGAFAVGYAYTGGKITASNDAAFAFGKAAGSGTTIVASGRGAFAFGYASGGGTITASANNAIQFGTGTNAQADSLSVGTTLRLKGTVAAPGTPRNGDIWVASNYVYIRSNNINVKIV